MPTDEEQRKKILEESEKSQGQANNRLCEHLAYIYGAKGFPEHLKTEITINRKKKKSTKKQFIRKYINIDTGEIIDEIRLKQLQKENKGDDER